jgi:energy-coupling factor transport system substrate-specific component
MLVSMNAILRFAEVAMPGPGGFSPIFFLIVLTGYTYGGGFGFLMGAMTLLVSALITAGVGPWLPYQMFTAGWVGMSAALCRPLVSWLGWHAEWPEVVILAGFNGIWGLLYGAIMNVWFWPFAIGPAEQHWQPGMAWTDAIGHYALFYAATSLAWDAMRLLGNVILTLSFGLPTLRALRRFQRRFDFSWSAAPSGLAAVGAGRGRDQSPASIGKAVAAASVTRIGGNAPAAGTDTHGGSP